MTDPPPTQAPKTTLVSGTICDPGNRGWFLPFTDDEQYWDEGGRGFLIAIEMVYCFLGVSILADIFVGSISVITSRRKKVRLKNGRVGIGMVWNDTVANLSLMALGSSAPEICLSTVEILKKDMFIGKLGVATILGSGAFNLLIIVAVCVMAIPSTEVRLIENLPAFYITALFSIGAYLWLGFILVTSSTDIVDVWEALGTLALLPVLVWVSYKVDIGAFDRFMHGRMLEFLHRIAPSQEDKVELEPASSATTPILGFVEEAIHAQGMPEKQALEVNVKLSEASSDGTVCCSYRTEQFSAVSSYDFEEAEGKLEFPEGVATQCIKLQIPPKAKHKIAREFFVILEAMDDADGLVKFDPDAGGDETSAILTVKIDAVSTTLGLGGRLLRCLDAVLNIDHWHFGNSEWLGQFPAALYCNGSAEEQKEASKSDWFWHILCLPWNLLFTLVPPPSYCGGWICFVACLGFLAVLAALLTDMAELFGCVLEVEDLVTAVTFVSMGTSVPDLFASLSAAKMEPNADASIVNVTGSNSVNVFLGLGLPYTIGAVYWMAKGPNDEWKARYPDVVCSYDAKACLVVDSLHLGWGVLLFLSANLACISVLLLRRKLIGAELGGPFFPKMMTGVGFIGFWCGFIAVICYRSMRIADASTEEKWVFMSILAMIECVIWASCVAAIVQHWRRSKDGESEPYISAEPPPAPDKPPPATSAWKADDKDDEDSVVMVPVVPTSDPAAPIPGSADLM